MSKTRSRNAAIETPAHWEHVNIVKHPGSEFYFLTSGVFDSFIGFLTCKAAGIPNLTRMTLSEALENGTKLETWLKRQAK